MPRSFKLFRIFIYILFALILTEIGVYISFSATGFFDSRPTLDLIFGIATPLIIFFWSFLLTVYVQKKSAYNQLFVDNDFYFAEHSFFFNEYMFSKAVRPLTRSKKSSGYVISFTGCSQESSTNLIRNDTVTHFNCCISKMVTKYFTIGKEKTRKGVCYGYNRESFVVFVATTEEEEINKIIRDFEANIYQIAKENEFRILVQPFFGVCKFNREDTITANIENANLARHNSEKHFELATYFDTSLQYISNSEETNEIIQALKDKEFVVYYQPKFNLTSKTFISSEALIRWDSKKYGLLSPGSFIAKAEAAGLIHDLDVFVFQQVCKDLKDMRIRQKRIIPVSINFSLYEFYSPNFIQYILDTVDSNGIPRNLIEIEITETTTQANSFLCISVIKKLRDEGIRILMDDFGVGYSNFNNLRKMPIDSIKIDKVFIDDIVNDTKTRNIVAFLISLGKVNGLEVIAEGVDNKDQVDILRRIKLDTIQGFYYSKPLPRREYEKFLDTNDFEVRGVK